MKYEELRDKYGLKNATNASFYDFDFEFGFDFDQFDYRHYQHK